MKVYLGAVVCRAAVTREDAKGRVFVSQDGKG